jgi:cation transport ATPase
MAKIDKETGLLITFYLSLLCTLVFPIYVIYDWDNFKTDESIYPILTYLFFGPLLLGVSCNYYRKNGWSELLEGSLGCLILIILFLLITFIYSLF